MSDVIEAFKNNIFPYVGTRKVGKIKPLELLNVLRKIENVVRWRKCGKCISVARSVFLYAIVKGRAEYNPAADLSSVLEVHQSIISVPKADELWFLSGLDSYTAVTCPDCYELLMITGVRTI